MMKVDQRLEQDCTTALHFLFTNVKTQGGESSLFTTYGPDDTSLKISKRSSGARDSIGDDSISVARTTMSESPAEPFVTDILENF